MKGWLRTKEEVLPETKEYWNFRDELVVQDESYFEEVG